MGDLHRDVEVVQQRRVNVAELMPRPTPESRRLRCRLQHVVHVLVGWTGHRVPVDGRVAEKDAQAFPGWQRGIEGSNIPTMPA